MVKTYYLDEDGRPTIDKDPNSEKLFGVNLSAELAANGGTLVSVTGVVNGVEFRDLEEAFVAGTNVAAWLIGGDSTIQNYITFSYVLSDGTKDDITLYFNIKEN